MHILFVCTGNTCRSPMAEGYFRHLTEKGKRKDITCSSAGTFAGDGEPASPNSVRAMKQIGVDISRHRSSSLTEEMLDAADIIIALTQSHRFHIGKISAAYLKKTRILGEFKKADNDVADPFGGSPEEYSFCLDSMIPSLEKLFNELQ